MKKKKPKNAIVIVDGLYGDMFKLNGVLYCLNTIIKINGKEIPAALIPID